jgi:hypothetical protein
MSRRCKVRTPRHRAALAEEEGKEGSHSIRVCKLTILKLIIDVGDSSGVLLKTNSTGLGQ